MNKLYEIHFKLPNGYTISVWYGWSEDAAKEKMRKNPEFKFTLVEDNDTHKVWDAE